MSKQHFDEIYGSQLLTLFLKESKQREKKFINRIQENFTWTMPIKENKKTEQILITGDMYIHLEWKEWLKFIEKETK